MSAPPPHQQEMMMMNHNGHIGQVQPYDGAVVYVQSGPPAPAAQSMDANRSRPIFAPLENAQPGVSRLLYHGYASEGIKWMHAFRGILNPFTCACLPSVSSELKKGRYVQVYDNRIEINEPSSCCLGCCCTCVVQDRITTIHYDRALVQSAAKATPCGPNCTHGDCMPDCCGLYGETLVISGDRVCCGCLSNCCTTVNTTSAVHISNGTCFAPVCDPDCEYCCISFWPHHKFVFGLENATEIANQMNTARNMKGLPRPKAPF